MASLFKRKNGVFYTAYVDRRGRRRWVSTRSRDYEEGSRIAASLVRGLERRGQVRFEELVTTVLRSVQSRLSTGTYGIYVRTLSRAAEQLGNRPLQSISVRDAEDFVLRRSKVVNAVTVNLELRTLRAAFQRGVDWGMCETNPFANVKPLRIPQIDPVFVSKVQIRMLLDAEPDPLYRDLFAFAVLSMLRVGEIVNLKWVDVDLRRRVIRVCSHGSFRVKGLKNRNVPLNAETMQMLQRRQGMMNGQWVFSKEGRQLNTRTISHRFKKQCRKTGVDPRIHFHSLRHTGASWLAQAGVSLLTIQKILGHSSPTVTQIYSHLSDSHLHEAVGLLSTSDLAGPSHATGPTPVFSSN